jgi:glucose/arabinose dehydrogenase
LFNSIKMPKKLTLGSYLLTSFCMLSILITPVFARQLRTEDIAIPNGYKIEIAVAGLSSPTMVTFDDTGRMLIAESGYGGGQPQISRIETDGTKTALTQPGVFGTEVPVTAVAHYQGQIYVVHAGTISIVENDGRLRTVISGLPGQGDHQANQLLFQSDKMYFTIGTVTNSAVVGPDNVIFGWLKQSHLRNLHDVPCQDITLSATSVFTAADLFGANVSNVKTSAFAAFGTDLGASGATVKGSVKCNGALLRANPDGTDLQVVAWGFRNPYGLEVGPDNSLYVTMHGFDARGSRPIENAWDCFYKVAEGAWYGWPDFACDVAVTDPQFKTKDQPQPQFVMTNHPTSNPPQPIAKFNPHSAINGFAFAKEGWGKSTDVFIAVFGDFTPATGTVNTPQGVKVVKLDTTTGEISDFISNKQPGQASRNSAGGLEHPSDVTFGPDGAMYITDWGVANVSVEGLKLEADSGVIWKVTKQDQSVSFASTSLLQNIVLTAALILSTFAITRGKEKQRPLFDGIAQGAIAGLVMGIFTILVALFILKLPWYAPPRVLATLAVGESALANILQFELVSFIIGILVLLVLTGIGGGIFNYINKSSSNRRIFAGLLFGLTVWALLQYLLLPIIQPLVTEKGFPPVWYAASFAVYGLVLGIINYLRSSNLLKS